VSELKKGDSFGELSLIYGAVRSATIVTSEPTELIVLDKITYDQIVKGVHVDQIHNTIEFLKHFPVFQDMSPDLMTKLATKAIYKKYPTNTVIIRQGDEPFSVYFIKSGRFKVKNYYYFDSVGIKEN